MRLSDLRTDPAKEKGGVEVPWKGDVVFRIRRFGNEDYRRAMSDGLKPHRALIRANALPPEVLDKITRAAYATHILVGWTNLFDDKDEPIPYSQESAEKLFADPGFHDLYEFVIVASTTQEHYRAEQTEEDLGNSQRSSTGSGSGDPSKNNSGQQAEVA